MLMEVKNQFRVTALSIKYALEREMLNKVTFITNIIFMILNNASFIIQWIIIYSIKDSVGGYTFKQVLLLWGMAALTYGISRFFFKDAFGLSSIINSGRLDNYLVQPKNVLIQTITGSVSVSALGDILYGYIMLFIFGINLKNFILLTICGILGALLIVSVSVIFSSLAFWFGKTDTVADTVNSLMTNFATYPEGIFKGIIKVMFYTVIPLGLTAYLPVQLISNFNIIYLLYIFIGTIIFVTIAFYVFYKGLNKYSSTNLMNSRV